MRRTKEWWAQLSTEERSRLVYLERSENLSGSRGTGGLPDDCSECGSCGWPHLGTGLCDKCLQEMIDLIEKADNTCPVQ